MYSLPKWSFRRRPSEDERINSAADCEDGRRIVNTISGSIPMADFDVSCVESMDSVSGSSVKDILFVHKYSYVPACYISR